MAIATMYLSFLNEADDVVSRLKVAAHGEFKKLAQLAIGSDVLIEGEPYEIVGKIDGAVPEYFFKAQKEQSPPIRYH